jgi:hypothetical protein
VRARALSVVEIMNNVNTKGTDISSAVLEESVISVGINQSLQSVHSTEVLKEKKLSIFEERQTSLSYIHNLCSVVSTSR